MHYSYKHGNRKSNWIAGFVPSCFPNGKLLCGWRFTCYLLSVCWYLSERPKKRERKWTGIKDTLSISWCQFWSHVKIHPVNPKKERHMKGSLLFLLRCWQCNYMRMYLPKEIHFIIPKRPWFCVWKHAEISCLHVHVHGLRERENHHNPSAHWKYTVRNHKQQQNQPIQTKTWQWPTKPIYTAYAHQSLLKYLCCSVTSIKKKYSSIQGFTPVWFHFMFLRWKSFSN